MVSEYYPLGGLQIRLFKTLVVSDLHLEKGTRATLRRGGHVPPYDTRETLVRLAQAMSAARPERLIFLGDTFDDVGGLSRLSDEDRRALDYILQGREVVWIVGNHDPLPQGSLPGLITPEYRLENYIFRHEADPAHLGPEIEVSGHFHPAAKVKVRGAVVRRPCFVEAEHRIILPAMGAYTGGLNVLDPAFDPLNLGDFKVHVLGKNQIYTFPRAQLV